MKMLLSFDCKFAMFTIVMSNNVNEFFFQLKDRFVFKKNNHKIALRAVHPILLNLSIK